MRRFRDDRPADICFARGTFNSHPYVMAAMNEFLRHLQTPQAQRSTAISMRSGTSARGGSTSACARRRCRCGRQYVVDLDRLLHAAVALQLDAAILPARRGLALSWVGTGRLIFSLNYTDADFAAVADRFVAAARAMQSDGWWWSNPALTNKSIKRAVLKEMITHRFFSRDGR